MRLMPASVLSALALLAPIGAAASPMSCQPGTAADYLALGAAGCLDSFGVLLNNFAFSTSGGISVPLSEVMVSPGVSMVPAFVSPTGITVDFSPAIVVPPSKSFSVTLGFTETFQGAVPLFAADFLSLYTNQFNTDHPDPFIRTFDFTVTTNGKAMHFDDGPYAGIGASVPIMQGSSASMLLTYAFYDPPTTQTTIQGFELATERLPEPSTWVLMVSGLFAAGLIRGGRPRDRGRQ
jgi:hypothetical protein